jgi:hypothetical protein
MIHAKYFSELCYIFEIYNPINGRIIFLKYAKSNTLKYYEVHDTDYDKDFISLDQYIDNRMTELRNEEKCKNIYLHDEWFCTDETMRYMFKIMLKNDIRLEDVIRIYRSVNTWIENDKNE